MGEAIRIWAVVSLLGVAALPLTRAVFRPLPGGGAGLERLVGLLLVGSALFLGVSLGIASNTTAAVWVAVAILLAAGAYVHLTRGTSASSVLERRLLIGSEVVFFAGFFGAAFLLQYGSDLWQSEHPQDMMFLTASREADSFPPADPWLSGETVNYYYFGQYLCTLVLRLADVGSEVGYTLSIALVWGLASSAVFAVAGSLAAASDRQMGPTAPLLAGGVAVALTLLAGSPYTLDLLASHDGPLGDFDWNGVYGAIPDGLSDFPYHSLLDGNLHAHLIALPFTLLAAALGLHVAKHGPLAGSRTAAVGRGALTAVCLAAIWTMHGWSVPVVATLLGLAAAAHWWRSERTRQALLEAAGWTTAVVTVAFVLVLPFQLHYDPYVSLGLVREHRSLPNFIRDMVMAYGTLLVVAVATLAIWLRLGRRALFGLLVAAVILGAALLPFDLSGPLLVAGLVGLALLVAARLKGSAERYAFLLVTLGLGCILLPELIYVRDVASDVLGGRLYRANTIFRFGYNAWLLIGVAAGALVAWAAVSLPRRALYVAASGLAVVAIAGFVYPLVGTYGRSNGFRGVRELDPTARLAAVAPGDIAVIRWLRSNTPQDAVLLEAVGRDYSEQVYTRVSTLSGRTTVVGFPDHERIWGRNPARRVADVRTLYTTPDPSTARALLTRYGVQYVVVGPLERSTYPDGDLNKFATLGRVILSEANTTLYRVNAPSL